MDPGQYLSMACERFSQKVFWEAAQWSRKEQWLLCQHITFKEFSCSHISSSTYKVGMKYNKLAKFSCNSIFHFLDHFRYDSMCPLNSLFEPHKDTCALSLIWGGYYKWLGKQLLFSFCMWKFSHTNCSLIPRPSPTPSFPSLAVWLSGRGPGTFSHVSDVRSGKTVERLIEHGWA